MNALPTTADDLPTRCPPPDASSCPHDVAGAVPIPTPILLEPAVVSLGCAIDLPSLETEVDFGRLTDRKREKEQPATQNHTMTNKKCEQIRSGNRLEKRHREIRCNRVSQKSVPPLKNAATVVVARRRGSSGGREGREDETTVPGAGAAVTIRV